MTEGQDAAEARAKSLALALEELGRAEVAAGGQSWKAGLRACRRLARIARLNAHERLLAAVLARAVRALMPLAGTSPQRVRQLLELLDEAVEAQPHDIDLAHALHDVLSTLLTALQEKPPPRRTRRALARLGMTYGRPLCGRFPKETAFAETCAALLELARKA